MAETFAELGRLTMIQLLQYKYGHIKSQRRANKRCRAWFWVGVAVHRMKKVQRVSLTTEQIEVVRSAYDQAESLDSIIALQTNLAAIGLNVTRDELEDLLISIPFVKGQRLAYDSFIKMIEILKGKWTRNIVSDTAEAFSALGGNRDGTGYIVQSLLKRTMDSFELQVDTDNLMAETNKDNDERVDFMEFTALLSETREDVQEVRDDGNTDFDRLCEMIRKKAHTKTSRRKGPQKKALESGESFLAEEDDRRGRGKRNPNSSAMGRSALGDSNTKYPKALHFHPSSGAGKPYTSPIGPNGTGIPTDEEFWSLLYQNKRKRKMDEMARRRQHRMDEHLKLEGLPPMSEGEKLASHLMPTVSAKVRNVMKSQSPIRQRLREKRGEQDKGSTWGSWQSRPSSRGVASGRGMSDLQASYQSYQSLPSTVKSVSPQPARQSAPSNKGSSQAPALQPRGAQYEVTHSSATGMDSTQGSTYGRSVQYAAASCTPGEARDKMELAILRNGTKEIGCKRVLISPKDKKTLQVMPSEFRNLRMNRQEIWDEDIPPKSQPWKNPLKMNKNKRYHAAREQELTEAEDQQRVRTQYLSEIADMALQSMPTRAINHPMDLDAQADDHATMPSLSDAARGKKNLHAAPMPIPWQALEVLHERPVEEDFFA